MHFSNIVQEGEFEENETSISSKELFKDQSEFSNESFLNSKNGGRPEIWHNLDAMISIGYKINSKKATKFRKWSREIIKQYMRKGYVLNKELLINGGRFTSEYFDGLLEEIREIRTKRNPISKKRKKIEISLQKTNP